MVSGCIVGLENGIKDKVNTHLKLLQEFLKIMLKKKKKKIVKEQIIPSGHNRDNYMVERLNCESHDGRKIPMTITYHKETKLDGSAHVLLYGYGSYGYS